ncbi:MAG TPA: DUF1549 and DUF1553 domain-containing protein [Tepidisphaeraceae bacterium]|jgi:hypothetical protein|nr:DUF1549 and DUF1553 domain-containing protein [Tepidisphaeraceae bacterium]
MRSTRLNFLAVLLVAIAPQARADSPARSDFWSFRPLAKVEPPAVKDQAWARNPVDRFLLATLEEKGLSPAAPLDRPRLIRRIYFDVIGLPPSPEELSAATEDPAPDWYERLVDKLLASPHLGERWARHWLDVARYADSDGYEGDRDRPGAFPYRDFVIRAFNDDLPYNTFLQWQLAGDELSPGNPQALAATGFIVASPNMVSDTKLQSELDKYRYDELDDVLGATGQAMLAMTLNCARCHDHKFDPIPTRDYYRMLAAFTTSKRVEVPFMSAEEAAAFQKETGEFDKRMAAMKAELDALANDAPEKEREAKRKAVEQLEKSRPQPPKALVTTDEGPQPAKSFLLRRGDPSHPDAEVILGFLSVLTPESEEPRFKPDPPPGARTTFQRAALARWITDVDHGGGALAARVAVNRLWQHHFGEGLVRTPGDFGAQGDRPSHPELLDYLATQLITHNWSLKHVHRLLLTSNAYRMGTTFDATKSKPDPENRLLWRRRPARLEGEALRDAILNVSGALNPQMFGPAFKPPAVIAGRDKDDKIPRAKEEGPAVWRRSVYLFTKRSLPIPLLEAFDAPTGNSPCTRRLTTTVATQSLALLDDPFVRIQAEHFAKRLIADAGQDSASRVRRAYTLALSREPTAAELKASLEFVDRPDREGAFVDLCQVLFGLNEFAYVD